jgi:hypothetical protein
VAYNVSSADIEARWRPLADAESDVASVLLDDATRKLDMARPGLAAAVASTVPEEHVPEELVIAVLCDMVIRVMVNPDFNKAITIGADGSVSISFSEIFRARIGIAPGDLDAIDAALRVAGAMTPVFVSRTMRSTMNYRTSTE